MTNICAIVLAAGRSRRMGTQKLLLPFAGQTVIARVVDQVLRSPVRRVVVVVGSDAGAVAGALAGRAVTPAANPDADGDMLSSVRRGLRAAPDNCDAVLVVLGDQPAIRAERIGDMAAAFEATGRGIVVPVHGGRRGHPILLSTYYVPEILTGHDGTGLRGLLQSHPDDVHELESPDDSVLADMDHPEDYQRELARLRGSTGLTQTTDERPP